MSLFNKAKLDCRLASGELPDSDPVLTARAAQLTTRRSRRLLARDWAAVAQRIRSGGLSSRAPLAYSQLDAAGEIDRLVALLRSDEPVSANVVAAARLLLSEASSPLFRVGTDGGDLAAAITRAAFATMAR